MGGGRKEAPEWAADADLTQGSSRQALNALTCEKQKKQEAPTHLEIPDKQCKTEMIK